VTLPRFVTDLLGASMQGDWFGNLQLGLGAVAVAAGLAFLVALAVRVR
jgi:hypothetical protein